jgi:hypothetical protein
MAINVLQQATSWKDDLIFPVLPSLSEKEEVKTEVDHGSEKETSSSENLMDTSETKTVSSQSIVGQICFDLGTLYFYKGNIEKAKSLFETCSGVQVNK